ncbi:2-isopropylmalate synthase [Candidatus Magnetobacterium bavaricum]|uniref:2-isopropylmalate synthase n=1 Tax=Candidatus Magnetobacterium bavaricum TaxID=29290 RepID=A0A0F3GWL4_9BACT|nr:2-isopropylmalate synthase [Candidatus Magnetobacterium bavaricum]
MRQVRVFDTTLRDGEQSPGATMNLNQKLQIARQLANLKVDIIEAGFPITSQGDFEAVKVIAEELDTVTVAGLARARFEDIDRVAEAIKNARRTGRIHIVIATSDIHLRFKLKMTREDVLSSAIKAVRHACQYTDDIEFSAEDATRSDWDFLCRVTEEVINAGATTVNIPDTVGYTVPIEYSELIEYLMNKVPNIDKCVLSVHCHNDLGLAVSNSLAAIMKGAGQVECTINGIGERAGNASLEEIVMALKTRPKLFMADTGIVTREIYKTSRMVSKTTGMIVQPNKAIVGANAFAHESGIHQDGFLKERSTYEILRPEDIGIPGSKLVLGKHSGRAALKDRLRHLGFLHLTDDEVNRAFERFKTLADQKKCIFDEDIETLINEEISQTGHVYSLVSLVGTCGTEGKPLARITISKLGQELKTESTGDGPVDAAYNAIAQLTQTKSQLLKYEVKSITGGTDAQAEVFVTLEEEGRTVRGSGSHTDTIVASAKAYIDAINKLEGKQRVIEPGV